MPDKPNIINAQVARRGAGPLNALQGLNALNEIVGAAKECIAIQQVESTKRQQIRTYEATEVARIKEAGSVLKEYFTQVFAERRSNFEELFNRLDDALESHDGETANLMLRGIVDIAKSSPIADLGDLGQIRVALDDPDHIFEL
ncbi:hypothetical protein [Mycolicibacter algericus]|uniref:hypothetical protein n=1 Tax=Mycolicibacter algericus TaxID=1288388 RepID=UPI003C74C697